MKRWLETWQISHSKSTECDELWINAVAEGCVLGRQRSRAKADYAVIILALYYLITVTEFIMGSNEATKHTGQEKQLQQTAFNSSMRRVKIVSRWMHEYAVFTDKCEDHILNGGYNQRTDLLLPWLCKRVMSHNLLARIWWVSLRTLSIVTLDKLLWWSGSVCLLLDCDCTNELILMRVGWRRQMVRGNDDRTSKWLSARK